MKHGKSNKEASNRNKCTQKRILCFKTYELKLFEINYIIIMSFKSEKKDIFNIGLVRYGPHGKWDAYHLQFFYSEAQSYLHILLALIFEVH